MAPTTVTLVGFRSVVSDLIDFEAEENPSWRKEHSEYHSVASMIESILNSQRQWLSMKQSCDEKLVEEIHQDMLLKFIFHSTNEEGQGYGSIEETEECLKETSGSEFRGLLSREAQETINFQKAYNYLSGDLSNEICEENNRGLIDESLLKLVNKQILYKLSLPKGSTKPGVFSKKQRITEFKGEIHVYPQPEDMERTVCTILDRYNSLFVESTEEKDEKLKLYKLFKTCSWLLFELLDLHPFSDGNGRLCRLLCSYVLSICTPFPTPVYNIFSSSCLHDFKQALVKARKSNNRHPRSLTTMIIECNWKGWEYFLAKAQPA